MMGAYVFRDEFQGAYKSAPDPSKWNYDLGKWPYNNELETYTDSRANSYLDGNGHLVIQALPDGEGGYTSARLNTLGKAQFTHGNFSARIKLSLVRGVWPAWWLLGSNMSDVGWPACGEVDMMEWYGNGSWGPTTTLHTPVARDQNLDASAWVPCPVTSGWHVYKVDYGGKESFTFYVDNVPYWNATTKNTGLTWPFLNNPLFMVLNLAVGGDGGGVVPEEFTGAQMLVDWVRVWQS